MGARIFPVFIPKTSRTREIDFYHNDIKLPLLNLFIASVLDILTGKMALYLVKMMTDITRTGQIVYSNVRTVLKIMLPN